MSEETGQVGTSDWRRLTAGEISLLAEYNGMKIRNVQETKVYHRAFFGWPTMVTPDNNIYVGPDFPWSEDYSAEGDIDVRSQIVHELLHVYQTQNRGCETFCKLIKKGWAQDRDDYCYSLTPGKSFWSYGLEQEAEMVSDRYLMRESEQKFLDCNQTNGVTLPELEQLLLDGGL